MFLRRGIVVATHPEDHSVDLVMADNGQRLVGIQVVTHNGSTRTGSVDLPAVPEKKDKWDVTQETGQDMIAMVASYGRNPIVVGFLYPQVNQVLPKDPKRKTYRHQSDVAWSIDGDGNIQLDHPSGTYIRIGEQPDREETAGKNADGNAAFDRNTGKRVNVRIGLAGGKGTLTITPDGAVSFDTKGDFSVKTTGAVSVEAAGAATVKAASVTLDTASTTIKGDVQVEGTLTADTDVIADGVSLHNHVHKDTMSGSGTSGVPVAS